MDIPEGIWFVVAVAAFGLLLGWLLLHLSGAKDRRGWIYARAPGLPIAMLAEHDDAWIRGRVECDSPLRCPWYDELCVYYRYEIEVEKTRSYTDAQGKRKTRTEWVTDFSATEVLPFDLVDGDDRIRVQLPEGELRDGVTLATDYEHSRRRHSARVLPVGQAVSVLGVKRDDGTFGPLREVPLLVTFAGRDKFIASTGSHEKWLRWFGFVFLFCAGFGGFLAYRGMDPEGFANASVWVFAAALGVATLAPFWFISTFNRVVRTRHQAEAAWRQIDVDLAVRNQLIPQLTAVVKGYQVHERELLERATRLRLAGTADEKISEEATASGVARDLIALRERYPELDANSLFTDLSDKLWALEEKLAVSRNFYNGVCREWNTLIEGFPSVLVAKLWGQRPRRYFAGDEAV